jgi:hypothetical protein
MATLSQGPQPQFRNMLADAIRDYTPTLANRLNDPTSGAGLAVDAVGGLADMLIGQPYRSMTNLLSRPYVSGDPQAAEDAFNVAGAAMVGGVLAPRPKQPAPAPVVGYRGSPYEGGHTRNYYWGSADRDIAGDYALVPGNDKNPRHAPNVTPAEFRFKNPNIIDADGASWDRIKLADGSRTTTDNAAEEAAFAGHDGLIIRNVSDPIGFASDAPQTTIAALQRGTVYSPLTGELLYANGGPFGGLAGLLSGYGYQQQNQLASDWTRNLRPGDI